MALEKPNPRETTQWYFQRYVAHLPSAGEIVLFDRSWYNRAGVERVMGYCTDEQYQEFLIQTPLFEQMLGTRPHPPLQVLVLGVTGRATYPLSDPPDRPGQTVEALPDRRGFLSHWDDYTKAKERMFAATDTENAPWTVVKSNDKRRGRLNAMRFVLASIDYADKDYDVVGTPDPLIVGRAASVYELGEHATPARH